MDRYTAIIHNTPTPARMNHETITVVHHQDDDTLRPVAVYDIGNPGHFGPGLRVTASHRLAVEGWVSADDELAWHRVGHRRSGLSARVMPLTPRALAYEY